MSGMYGPQGPYNYQYVQDKADINTDLPKDLKDKINLAEKKETKKSKSKVKTHDDATGDKKKKPANDTLL